MLHFTWQVLSLEFEDDEDLLLLDETVSQCYVCVYCRKRMLRLLYDCALWLVDIMRVIFSTSQKWLQKLENFS